MSRQARYRVAALALSGLIFGAPLLTNGTASAEQLDPSERRVNFAGSGVLGLSCASKPDVESITVPARSVVHLVNRTGHDAELKIGGVPHGTVPDDGAAEVLFRRGTTSVLLTPDCGTGDTAVPVMVKTEPSAAAADPAPAPTGGAAPGAAKTSGSGTAAGAANAHRTAAPVSKLAARDQARQHAEARPATTVGDAASASRSLPQGVTGTVSPDRILGGTTGVGVPVTAGALPSDVAPTASEAAGMLPVPPAADGSPLLPGTTASAPAEVTEPMAAVGPIREGRSFGLLGLTALVCVLGVATAAIRAIVSQRASHANMS
ncbi:hypothetical protein [Actinoplanes sp. NBRC 101535]|uniref:hypothetical protein n=1 Tax=Actinoplanes sp. NBRC 101535 TaxID=3032196 RepID=UPI00255504F2|nr:hypothetical protein [Actinoplanes sp. NBRC 101535]